MKWLAECSVAALREALEAVAPELAGYPVTVPGPAGKQDPLWHSGCVPAGDRFFVKLSLQQHGGGIHVVSGRSGHVSQVTAACRAAGRHRRRRGLMAWAAKGLT